MLVVESCFSLALTIFHQISIGDAFLIILNVSFFELTFFNKKMFFTSRYDLLFLISIQIGFLGVILAPMWGEAWDAVRVVWVAVSGAGFIAVRFRWSESRGRTLEAQGKMGQ